MDFHRIENVTVDDVLTAHMADVSIQEKYGVRYHQFWVNQKAGAVFCLTEGPDAKTCELVHQLAHGNVACAITEVEPGTLKLMMGAGHRIDHGLVRNADNSIDPGYRSILVIHLRGMINGRKNPATAGLLQIPEWAGRVARREISEHGGRETTLGPGDYLTGVFNDAGKAVECAQRIRHDLMNNNRESKVVYRIGLSADQPVTKDGKFFTDALQLAQHLSAAAGDNQILAASMVKKLCHETPPPAPSFRYLEAPEEDFVANLLKCLHLKLADDSFTIDHLCRDLGISRPNLYRKVTSLTGKAPNAFLRDLRLEKALHLLQENVRNVSQVAMEVGYANPSYFSKCFADKYGCTPSRAF